MKTTTEQKFVSGLAAYLKKNAGTAINIYAENGKIIVGLQGKNAFYDSFFNGNPFLPVLRMAEDKFLLQTVREHDCEPPVLFSANWIANRNEMNEFLKVLEGAKNENTTS